MEIKIDLIKYVTENLTEDEKDYIRLCLAFDEQVLLVVCEVVVGGCVDPPGGGAPWWIGGMAEKLRERLIPLMPQVAQELVKDLVHDRDRERHTAKQWEKWAWAMWHGNKNAAQVPDWENPQIRRDSDAARAELEKLANAMEAGKTA
jgi:hypothetical protein